MSGSEQRRWCWKSSARSETRFSRGISSLSGCRRRPVPLLLLAELKEQVRRIARTALQALGARQEQSPVVRQIMAEIQTSYMDDYSLKTLGAAYHINPVYLGQLIHKETGHSFSDCLHRVRIDKAMELLRGTGMKTHDIAKAVGYWDTAHFYKHFKKLVGVPPSQFRRLV